MGIRRSYAYDKAGQLVTIGDNRRGKLSYRYDPAGRGPNGTITAYPELGLDL